MSFSILLLLPKLLSLGFDFTSLRANKLASNFLKDIREATGLLGQRQKRSRWPEVQHLCLAPFDSVFHGDDARGTEEGFTDGLSLPCS